MILNSWTQLDLFKLQRVFWNRFLVTLTPGAYWINGSSIKLPRILQVLLDRKILQRLEQSPEVFYETENPNKIALLIHELQFTCKRTGLTASIREDLLR